MSKQHIIAEGRLVQVDTVLYERTFGESVQDA